MLALRLDVYDTLTKAVEVRTQRKGYDPLLPPLDVGEQT